jgi:hypothetical protein
MLLIDVGEQAIGQRSVCVGAKSCDRLSDRGIARCSAAANIGQNSPAALKHSRCAFVRVFARLGQNELAREQNGCRQRAAKSKEKLSRHFRWRSPK